MCSRAFYTLHIFLIFLLCKHGSSFYNCYANNCRARTTSSMLIFGGGPIKAPEIPELIALIEKTNRGLIKDRNDEIIKIMNTISTNNANKVQLGKCEGEWELLWTTEKETLFFIANGLFGSSCLEVSQSINFGTSTIKNLIKFDSNREFSVLGDLSVDKSNPRRINFKFKRADISIPPIPTLSLPPVGAGWFDNIYCNDIYRLSSDIRGDYLISKRKV